MNLKTISFATSIFFAGVGCSTLPRPTVTQPGEVRGAALASGPAIVHITTGGDGTATLYLVDDAGDGSTVCPSATVENATPLRILDGESHVSDLPVPGGKRVCAAFDSPALSMTWLAEQYTSNALDSSLVRPAPTGILLAKR